MQFLEYIACTVLLLDCCNTIILHTFHEFINLVHIQMICVMIPPHSCCFDIFDPEVTV